MNALRQLEWALLELQQSTPLASVSGAISEIAPTHFRVSGLSRFVRLGELIGVNSGGNAMNFGVRFTDVWVNKGGKWQMATWQSTRTPD